MDSQNKVVVPRCTLQHVFCIVMPSVYCLLEDKQIRLVLFCSEVAVIAADCCLASAVLYISNVKSRITCFIIKAVADSS